MECWLTALEGMVPIKIPLTSSPSTSLLTAGMRLLLSPLLLSGRSCHTIVRDQLVVSARLGTSMSLSVAFRKSSTQLNLPSNFDSIIFVWPLCSVFTTACGDTATQRQGRQWPRTTWTRGLRRCS